MNLMKVLDMAYNRGKFIDRCDDKLRPVITHICLVCYQNQLGSDSVLTNHWLSEIKGIVTGLMADEIKNGNTYIKRKKAVLQACDRANLITPKNLYLRSYSKFDDEGFHVEEKFFQNIHTLLKELLDNLVEVIATSDPALLDRWISDVKISNS